MRYNLKSWSWERKSKKEFYALANQMLLND